MICRLCLTSSLVSATGSCMCNGKALYCVLDAEGLRCVKCQGNTEGRHCERCKEGFYHQRAGESCSSCNCSPTGEDALWSEAGDVPLLCVLYIPPHLANLMWRWNPLHYPSHSWHCRMLRLVCWFIDKFCLRVHLQSCHSLLKKFFCFVLYCTGSLSPQCDSEGRCRCKAGFTGEKCDRKPLK